MTAGYWMLAAVAATMLVTGLPAAFVLLMVASVAATLGAATHAIEPALLAALPGRIVGLLESDLLQAMPLYVLMGAMLNRLPLAATLFRALVAWLPAGPGAARTAGLGLGALLGPMNGSVGGSVAMLTRAVYPPLRASGTAPAEATALVCIASTLGVVIPPSLVLILLGDAAMRAHTEALTITHASTQIINTQNVFRGALVPAALLFVLLVAVVWLDAARRRSGAPAPTPRPPLAARERIVAIATFAVIGGLLGAVAWGILYAVEAAASGAFVLLVAAIAARQLSWPLLCTVLRDTIAIAGALAMLFVAATSFTLVFRAFGTDRHLADAIVGLGGGAGTALAAVLGLIALCALVLDAFEIIFVVIPLVLPPLLVRVPDATWVSVLVLLTLQASFLIPPFGYAIMMTTGSLAEKVRIGPLARAVVPYLVAQWLVMAAVLAFPALTHVAQDSLDSAPPAPDAARGTTAVEEPISVPPNDDLTPPDDAPPDASTPSAAPAPRPH
ncbi:MAG: TRAP transporter large permease subunit [Proteobacteria bacterium]|nr:TRAP transporter large permease subunit [Pseudomonadota bacterium]